MDDGSLSNLMVSHQGHRVSFTLKESGRFDAVENQKIEIENIQSIKCLDCNIIIYNYGAVD